MSAIGACEQVDGIIASAGRAVSLDQMSMGQTRKAPDARKNSEGLPNALDLLVVCVGVGLGLDQAIMQVVKGTGTRRTRRSARSSAWSIWRSKQASGALMRCAT